MSTDRRYRNFNRSCEDEDDNRVQLVVVAERPKRGPQGLQGSQGSQGGTGLQGAQGLQGSNGANGTNGVQGAHGSPGAQGQQGIQGSRGIQGLLGTQGSAGTQGPIGAQGFQGLQGTQGMGGMNGLQGAQGFQGSQGPQGPAGIIGPLGPRGLQGGDGLSGLQGHQGFQGVIGTQGLQGIQGAQGMSAQTAEGMYVPGFQSSVGALTASNATGWYVVLGQVVIVTISAQFQFGTSVSNSVITVVIDLPIAPSPAFADALLASGSTTVLNITAGEPFQRSLELGAITAVAGGFTVQTAGNINVGPAPPTLTFSFGASFIYHL